MADLFSLCGMLGALAGTVGISQIISRYVVGLFKAVLLLFTVKQFRFH